MKIISAIFAVYLLSACAGVIVSTTENEEVENPIISSQSDFLDYGSGHQSISESELLEKWGSPTEIERLDSNREIWVYEFEDKIEKELLVMIGVIPITIDLPDETRKIAFTINEGKVIKAETKILKTNGEICGLVPTQHFGVKLGCTR
jgi:hypothetical protein